MNITMLSATMMLRITGRWLTNLEFSDRLTAIGGLGVGLLDELESAHETLLELADRRTKLPPQLRALLERAHALETTHDRKARALYYLLHGLIETGDDEVEVERLGRIEAALFPTGLRIVRLPQAEQRGAVDGLGRVAEARLRAQLRGLRVGVQTLEQVFDEWVEAGRALDDAIAEQAELRAALARGGEAVAELDVRGGRRTWLQAIHGVLWALEVKPELAPLREIVERGLDEGLELLGRRGAVEDPLDLDLAESAE